MKAVDAPVKPPPKGSDSEDPPTRHSVGTSSRPGRRLPLGLMPFAGAIIIWWLLDRSDSRRFRHVVPDITGTWSALVTDFQSGTILRHGWITLQEIAWGFAVALVAALVIGTLISSWDIVRRTFFPAIVFLQAVPKVALAPLLLTWFGFGLGSKIATAALIAFFPMLMGVLGGLAATRQEEIDLLRSLRATRWQMLRLMQIPRALPAFFRGMEVGAIFAIIGAIVGELVGAQGGLGYLILFRSTQLDLEGMTSIIIVLALLGVVVDLGVQALHRRFVFWEGY